MMNLIKFKNENNKNILKKARRLIENYEIIIIGFTPERRA